MNHKELLITLLGLDSDASDEVISNSAKTFQDEMVAFKDATEGEIETLKNSNKVLGDEKAALESEKETLNNSNNELVGQLVERDMAEFASVITNADEIKSQLLSNRDGTLKTLRSLKFTAPEKREALHNSRAAGSPKPVSNASTPALDEAAAMKINNRARELQKVQGIGYQQAINQAKRENPVAV